MNGHGRPLHGQLPLCAAGQKLELRPSHHPRDFSHSAHHWRIDSLRRCWSSGSCGPGGGIGASGPSPTDARNLFTCSGSAKVHGRSKPSRVSSTPWVPNRCGRPSHSAIRSSRNAACHRGTWPCCAQLPTSLSAKRIKSGSPMACCAINHAASAPSAPATSSVGQPYCAINSDKRANPLGSCPQVRVAICR